MAVPTEVHSGIYVSEGFLTQGEIDSILQYCNELDQAAWRLQGSDAPNISAIGLSSAILEKLQTVFDPSEYVVRNFNSIQRRRPKEKNHGISHYARKVETIRCIMSSIIIVNDEYEGGEMVFVNQGNFTIKPAAGSIIWFPPTEEYAYLVNEVTNQAPRYTIPEDLYMVEPDFPALTPLSI